MKTPLITILLAVFSLTQINTQGQPLDENLKILQDHTISVKGKKTEYQQKFTHNTDNQFLLSVSVLDVSKGKQKVMSVNAIDLNPNRITFNPVKEFVVVKAQTKAGKKLVKVVEDGKQENYDDELVFYAPGIEAARTLTDALKAVVKEAEEDNAGGIKFTDDKPTLLNEIKAGIKKVVINEDSYEQSFSPDEKNNNIISFVLLDVSKGNTEKYTVNAADLNRYKLDFSTSRDQVLINFQTKGDRDLIAYTKNDEIGNYTNKFEIKASTIEEGRTLTKQLSDFVELAEKAEKKDFSQYSYDQCADYLSKNIGKVVINEDAYDQQFSISQDKPLVVNFAVQDISKGDNYEYAVNAADLDKKPTTFDTKGNSVFITLNTNGDRHLIKVKKNDEDQNYDKDLSIRFQDIETARDAAEAFTRFKELADKKMESSMAFSSEADAAKYLTEAVGKVVINTNSYEQSLEKGKDNNCQMTYHFTDVSKDAQYSYEFNLKDLDLYKIHFDTKGSEALVYLEVKGRNKLIQSFKNGEADNYISDLAIKASGIEQARKIVNALKLLTEACGASK